MKLLIIGSSLTGKTTLLRKLKELGVTRLSEMDKELTLLNNGKFPETEEKQHRLLAPKVIDSVLNKRGNYIFFTNTDYFTTEQLRKAKMKGYIILSLRLPKDVLESRNRHRVRVEHYPDCSEYFEDMIAYQDEIKRYDLVDLELDATNTVEQTVRTLQSMMHPQQERKPILFFFVGLPFSGKTTFSKMISRKLNIPRIAFDERWVGLSSEFGDIPGKTGVAKWKFVKKSCETDLKRILKNGLSVVYDNLLDRVEHRDYARKIATACSATPICIFLDYSKTEVIDRRKKNLVTKQRHQVSDENFNNALRSFRKPLKRESCVSVRSEADIDELLKKLGTRP